MRAFDHPVLDLMPPDFAEGLDDWSVGDGTPDSPTYETADHARIAVNDADFGTCLEMRKVETVQRLRYMAELPVERGVFVEIAARLKAIRGPLAAARIAAWPGGLHARCVDDLPQEGPIVLIRRHGEVMGLRAVIGFEPLPGVDLVWDGRAMYAHVGLDLVGPDLGVVRIERLSVRDVTASFRVN